MNSVRQHPEPFVVLIAGTAGSGKSTLARAVAQHLAAPVLDLDTLTNPLLDELVGSVFVDHWLTGDHAAEVRRARYAALRETITDLVDASGLPVIAAAPFTAEVSNASAFDALRAHWPDIATHVVYLRGDAELFQRRRQARGEQRDEHRAAVDAASPAIAVIDIDAHLTTQQQVTRVLTQLGRGTPLDQANSLFDRTFDAVLFDLDGTLVDSTASVTRSWQRLAQEYGVSAQALQSNHGRPAVDLIARIIDEPRRSEALRRITELEVDDAVGLRPIDGADTFFAALPETARAIVTSGSVPIATARLRAAGIPTPTVFVTADDVRRAKPDPEPFLQAAARLGVHPSRCLVVEDAAAGVTAARAAGCAVLGITGTLAATDLHADMLVDDYRHLRPVLTAAGVRLELHG